MNPEPALPPFHGPRFDFRPQSGRLLAGVVFAVIAAIVLGLSLVGARAFHATDLARFEQAGQDIADAISDRLRTHLALIGGAAAYVRVADGVPDRRHFAAYVAALPSSEGFSGQQGLGFAQRVTPANAAAREQRLRETYDDATLAFTPDTLGERFPIVLLEPLNDRNRAALGYDMYSEPIRREAMERARRSGTPAMSGKVTLKQEIDKDKQAGFLVYQPVTSAAGELLGFAYAPFRAADFLHAVVPPGVGKQVALTLYDQEATPDNLLYRAAVAAPNPAFSGERTLELGGRRWVMALASTPEFERTSASVLLVPLALLGIIAAAAISFVLWQAAETQTRALASAEEGRRNAAEKTLLLQEMRHRLGNTIAKVQSIARQSARGARDVKEFLAGFEPRLQSMASRNELLIRTSWEGATLSDVLASELAPYVSEDALPAMLAGPPVQLSPRLVLALGLTFHELATNAAKYGGLSETGEGLKVVWRQTGGMLTIDWRERATRMPDDAPKGSGFGSKLIVMTIEREIGGRFTRDMRPEGLLCLIEVPNGAPAGPADPRQRGRVASPPPVPARTM